MAAYAGYTSVDLYKIANNQRRLSRVVLWSLMLVCFFAVLVYLSTYTPENSSSPEVIGRAQTYAIFTHERPMLSPNVTIILALLTLVSAVVLAFLWLIVFVRLLAGLQTRVLMRVAAIIGSFVPIVSLIVLALVLVGASRVLKKAGCRVGPLGVSLETLNGLKQRTAPQPWSPPAGPRRKPTSLESHLDSN